MRKIVLSIALVTAALAGNAQQLSNSGFETWSGSPSAPTGWGTLDQAIAASPLSALGNQGFVTQSSSPYAGTYAATLTTKTVAALGQTFPAAITYGTIIINTTNFTAQIQGTPFTYMPSSISYAAKGTVITGDSVPTYVFLTKWNTTSNKRDTVALGADYLNHTLSASTYTVRTFPVYYKIAAETPDTIQYIVSSSVKTSSPTVGTSVTIDAVNLMGSTTGIATNHSTQANTVAFPNPALNQITLATTSEKAKFANVYDLTGRLMSKNELINKQINIDLNSFNSGMYIYVITDENNSTLSTSKFSVSK
jgi:hypothetical protein